MGLNGIPAHQKAILECPGCKDTIFIPVSGIRFVYDRLAPDKIAPITVQLFKCGGCQGYLTKNKAGAWEIVHHEKPLEGDEWKRGIGP